MLFDTADAVGYFSGGCLEADVANHASKVLHDGEPRRLVYGRGSPWIDIRLLCGGTLEILLELIEPDDAAVGLLEYYREVRSPAWWASDGRTRSVHGGAPFDRSACALVRFDPSWRIILVGGDPIVLAMASLGASAGFETIIVRQDGPSDNPPLPGVGYVRENVAAAIEKLAPDRWTAVVSATHDDDIDDMAIMAALRSDAAYVGVLGSSRRVAARRERLTAAGLAATRVASLHAPIGVARCGKAPWEVAVSVIAEIMQTRTDLLTFAPDGAAGSLEQVPGLVTHG